MSQGLASIKLDLHEWKQAVARVRQFSSKSNAEFVNKQLRELVIEALKLTRAANPEEIRKIANFIKQERGKRGKLLKHAKFKYNAPTKDTYRIFEYIHKKKHGTGIPYGQINDYIYKQINKRLRSCAFIKAGWLPAIRILGGFKGKLQSKHGARQLGTDKGTARKAGRDPINLSCEAVGENWALVPYGKLSAKAGHPMKFAEAGVKLALRARIADVTKHFYEQAQKIGAAWAGRILSGL